MEGKTCRYSEIGVNNPRPNFMGLVKFNNNEGDKVGKIFQNNQKVKIKSFSVYICENSKKDFQLKDRNI